MKSEERLRNEGGKEGEPRERFILCVIDASFGRNAEEEKEEGNRN